VPGWDRQRQERPAQPALLPDAPVPDGRTVLTSRDTVKHPGGRGSQAASTPFFIRDTNLLERTFVEVRRRTKVIGRFPGETSALSLIWAVLELSSRGWRGVQMSRKTVAEIERLRRHLREDPAPPATDDAEEVIAA
jgi:hypothetical protein